MICILKFFENSSYSKDKKTPTPQTENSVISRTLLKIAVVSRHYKQKNPEKMPKHGELWKCRVVKEINSGHNRGCFVVEPMEQIDDKSILHLIPGWYDEKFVNGHLLIVPRRTGPNWLLPLLHKRIMADERGAYCVIVQLDAIPINDMPSGAALPDVSTEETD